MKLLQAVTTAALVLSSTVTQAAPLKINVYFNSLLEGYVPMPAQDIKCPAATKTSFWYQWYKPLSCVGNGQKDTARVYSRGMFKCFEDDYTRYGYDKNQARQAAEMCRKEYYPKGVIESTIDAVNAPKVKPVNIVMSFDASLDGLVPYIAGEVTCPAPTKESLFVLDQETGKCNEWSKDVMYQRGQFKCFEDDYTKYGYTEELAKKAATSCRAIYFSR